MEAALRASLVSKALDDISVQEALQIAQSASLAALAKQAGFARIKRSKEGLQSILDGLPSPPAAGAQLDELQAAIADCTLTFVEAVVTYSPSADMRAAQFHGFHKLADDHAQEIANAKSRGGLTSGAELLSKVKEATNVLRKLAKNPLDYVGVLPFWNKLVKPDPGLQRFTLLANPGRPVPDFSDLIDNDLAIDQVFTEFRARQLPQAQVDAIRKALQLTAQDMEIAAKWLGAAVVLITATTLVLNTVADDKHWASALATGVVAIGVPIALSEVITGAAVASVLTPAVAGISSAVSAVGSIWGAAAVTIEVPPVAFVLIATGVVLLLSIAIEQLFSMLLTAVVGGDIPQSMRAEMARPMAASMRLRIGAPMRLAMS